MEICPLQLPTRPDAASVGQSVQARLIPPAGARLRVSMQTRRDQRVTKMRKWKLRRVGTGV